MLPEVPLPSYPSSFTPPDFSDYSSYVSLVDVYHSEYVDELPSEIMNHFRTSTPRPSYSSQDTTSCDYNQFLSPCNPHLPSFSIKQLSMMSMLDQNSPAPAPSQPSSVSPPSGRIPYPSFRPEYNNGISTDFSPLLFRPRQYVPSSTIRPRGGQLDLEENRWTVREEEKITTYKPRITLNQARTTPPPDSGQRIRQRLREILQKLREKKMMGRAEEQDRNIPSLTKFKQRRKNGGRLYPSNVINPHLPVTSLPPVQTNQTDGGDDSLPTDDFFTVRNRNLGGTASAIFPSQLLWLLIILSQHIMGF